ARPNRRAPAPGEQQLPRRQLEIVRAANDTANSSIERRSETIQSPVGAPIRPQPFAPEPNAGFRARPRPDAPPARDLQWPRWRPAPRSALPVEPGFRLSRSSTTALTNGESPGQNHETVS